MTGYESKKSMARDKLNDDDDTQVYGDALTIAYQSGYSGIHTKTSKKKIEFFFDAGFGRFLTNPLVTDNGQTIGERNRAGLHAELDAWLDGTFEEKNNGT